MRCCVPCSWSHVKLVEGLSYFLWLQRHGTKGLTQVLMDHHCNWGRSRPFYLAVWEDQWSMEPGRTRRANSTKWRRKGREMSRPKWQHAVGEIFRIQLLMRYCSLGSCQSFLCITFPSIYREKMPAGYSVAKPSVVIWVQIVCSEYCNCAFFEKGLSKTHAFISLCFF